MNKLIISAIVATIILPTFSAVIPNRSSVIDPKVKNFLNGRRICVKRDTSTMPGYVISYWERNGRPDWKLPSVTTNLIQAVHGAEQMNPLQVDAGLTKKIKKAREKAAKKDAKALEKFIKDTYKAMEKSSEEMQELYRGLMDIIDPPKDDSN